MSVAGETTRTGGGPSPTWWHVARSVRALEGGIEFGGAGDDRETGAWGCAGLTGAAKANCQALLSCIRTSHCAQATNDAQACYFCTATDIGCLSGNANGACKAQYEAAAGTSDPGTIAGVFTDPSSPIGLADNEITCDADSSAPLCSAACPL